MFQKLSLLVIISLLSTINCESCKNPQVTSTSFTTQDATIVSNIAFIAEFTVNCESGQAENLYAEIDGNIVPVSVVGPNKFQVSWTEEPKTAKSGDRLVRIFNEDGYAAVRKALRSGEDPNTVPAYFNIVINYPGAYNGPWLKSEIFATIVSVIVSYLAISFKSQVTN